MRDFRSSPKGISVSLSLLHTDVNATDRYPAKSPGNEKQECQGTEHDSRRRVWSLEKTPLHVLFIVHRGISP